MKETLTTAVCLLLALGAHALGAGFSGQGRQDGARPDADTMREETTRRDHSQTLNPQQDTCTQTHNPPQDTCSLRRRPQTPRPPFPYSTEDVTFTNDSAHATLAGTLTMPHGKEHPPVVLMVTGSGLQNRDEELMGHRPFAVIADYLARHGIASLRYDDRTFGQSTGGDVKNATTRDFAGDAKAGLAWLRQSGRFAKVGILGHSEGGAIAFMLAAEGLPDFIVSLAGPAVRGDSLLLAQNKALLGALGSLMTIEKVRVNVLLAGNAWLRYYIDYDPQPDIARTHCPVMALNGSKDMQVIASQNLPALRRHLPTDSRHLIKEYAGLNHLFQHCQSGHPNEYATIEETIAEEVLQDITRWILSF